MLGTTQAMPRPAGDHQAHICGLDVGVGKQRRERPHSLVRSGTGHGIEAVPSDPRVSGMHTRGKGCELRQRGSS